MSLAYHHSYDQVIRYLWLSAEDLIFHILCRQCKEITLQELKLQGIKIRDGVVFSRYSRAQ